MVPAQCTGCGQTVLSRKSSFFKVIPTALCQGCGKRVKKRGGREEFGAILLFVALIVMAVSVAEDGYTGLIWAGAAVFAMYMEWWSWRTVPWDVDEPEDLAHATK